MSAQPANYPEVLEDIAAKLTEMLVDEGLAADKARAIAFRHAEQIRRDYGGRRLYIPSGVSFERDRVKRAIFGRWNSQNTYTLCKEFGITEAYLRQLFEEARREAVEQQPPLI